FLDGIEQWRVVGYAGVTPIVRAHVAAAIRLRGADRRPRTIAEVAEELAITRLDHLPAAVRAALEATGVSVVEISAEHAGHPARGPPHQRVPAEKPRRAPRNPLLVSPAVALGGERPLVRTAAGGSARASGNRRPSIRDLGLAHHRTRAARDARPALGSVTLSY